MPVFCRVAGRGWAPVRTPGDGTLTEMILVTAAARLRSDTREEALAAAKKMQEATAA